MGKNHERRKFAAASSGRRTIFNSHNVFAHLFVIDGVNLQAPLLSAYILCGGDATKFHSYEDGRGFMIIFRVYIKHPAIPCSTFGHWTSIINLRNYGSSSILNASTGLLA